jgi:hypothetical protein
MNLWLVIAWVALVSGVFTLGALIRSFIGDPRDRHGR